MKYFILLISLLPILLKGQNVEPVQQQFYFPLFGDTRYLSSDSAYFRQDKIILGNHWDSSPRLEKAVGYTQKDIYGSAIDSNKYIADNTLLHIKVNQIYPIWTHCQGNQPINARGIEYSPILSINPNLTHTLQTIPTSSRNPIFGFQTINGTKDTVNDCLIVDSTISNGTVILDEPWTADQLSYFKPESPDEITENNFLCKGMYITINLRRDDFSSKSVS